MDKKKYLYPAIGAAAFVIGGIVARAKAYEVMETVEKTFDKNKKPNLEVIEG